MDGLLACADECRAGGGSGVVQVNPARDGRDAVLVDGCVENSVAGTQHQAQAGQVLGNSNARRNVVLVGLHQAGGIASFSADEN